MRSWHFSMVSDGDASAAHGRSTGERRVLPAVLLLLLCALTLSAQSPPHFRLPDLERRLHDAVNRERGQRGVGALRFDTQLAQIARAHSADMARRKFFDHTNPDGLDPSARVRRAGYRCSAGVSENLFQSNLYSSMNIVNGRRSYAWNSAEDITRESVDGWMKSPGHRRNILDGSRHIAGVGAAIAPDDKVYITEIFC